MKTIQQIGRKLLLGICLTLSLDTNCTAQPLQFTAARVLMDEGVQLYWQSESNAVYRIEYASDLTAGDAAWSVLYDDYPSHGTNTFWMDTGDYDQVPAIPYFTKAPMRFYRIFNKGTNSAPAPSVSITSVSNGAALSGEVIVSVVASSSMPVLTTALFVDGQEMDSSEDGTNYMINTCEWPNGPHVLFATAKAQSTLPGPSGVFPIEESRAASGYTSVTFDNLIHTIAFSEHFFEPSLGQTQHVSAAFATNVNWTLEVIDESSNAVRTVTGGGTALHYDWDGTDDANAAIPDGVYHYRISAEIGGQSLLMGLNNAGPLSSMSAKSADAQDSPVAWAIPSKGSSDPVPLQLFPPGMATNHLIVFEASHAEMSALHSALMGTETEKMSIDGSGAGDPIMSFAGSSQTTVAPTKPPTKPVKNAVGTIGTAFYEFAATNSFNVPKNGLPLPGNAGKVEIENYYGSLSAYPISVGHKTMKKFTTKMTKNGWKLGFNKTGASLSHAELKKASLGGSNLFGGVNLGIFLSHGSYGTSLDYHSFANQSLQTYFVSDNPADSSNPWIALSEFGFGGGNLRWMAVLACNSLRDEQYQSMHNQGVLPLENGNHLICGLATVGGVGEDIGELWAKKMLGGLVAAEKVKDAWFSAGRKQYQGDTSLTNDITFRVFGWEDCMDDKLNSYSPTTSGDIVHEDSLVYP